MADDEVHKDKLLKEKQPPSLNDRAMEIISPALDQMTEKHPKLAAELTRLREDLDSLHRISDNPLDVMVIYEHASEPLKQAIEKDIMKSNIMPDALVKASAEELNRKLIEPSSIKTAFNNVASTEENGPKAKVLSTNRAEAVAIPESSERTTLSYTSLTTQSKENTNVVEINFHGTSYIFSPLEDENIRLNAVSTGHNGLVTTDPDHQIDVTQGPDMSPEDLASIILSDPDVAEHLQVSPESTASDINESQIHENLAHKIRSIAATPPATGISDINAGSLDDRTAQEVAKDETRMDTFMQRDEIEKAPNERLQGHVPSSLAPIPDG